MADTTEDQYTSAIGAIFSLLCGRVTGLELKIGDDGMLYVTSSTEVLRVGDTIVGVNEHLLRPVDDSHLADRSLDITVLTNDNVKVTVHVLCM